MSSTGCYYNVHRIVKGNKLFSIEGILLLERLLIFEGRLWKIVKNTTIVEKEYLKEKSVFAKII